MTLIKSISGKELVVFENEPTGRVTDGGQAVKQTMVSTTETEAFLEIDRNIGLSYVMDSEELYQEILQAFYEQIEEYLPQLKTCYEERNWSAYAVLAHAIKGNSRNIGAIAFSDFSKKQEFAAKAGEEKQLMEDYDSYVATMIKLSAKVKDMIDA